MRFQELANMLEIIAQYNFSHRLLVTSVILFNVTWNFASIYKALNCHTLQFGLFGQDWTSMLFLSTRS